MTTSEVSSGAGFLTNPESARSTWIMAPVTLLAVVALCITCYLAYVAFTKSKIAGCDAGQIFDCGHVINSRWSQVFGIPVSVPAAGLYLSMLGAIAALLGIRSRQRAMGDAMANEHKAELAKSAIMTLSLMAALSAVWFIGLQVFALKHYCTYCLVAHGCGLAIAGVLLFDWRKQLPISRLVAISAAAVGLLIAAQIFGPIPPTYAIETHSRSATENGEENSQDEGAAGVFDFDPDAPTAGENAAPWSSPTPIPQDSPPDSAHETSANSVVLPKPASPIRLLAQAPPQAPIKPDGVAPNREQPNFTAPRRIITALGGSLKLDIRQWPRIGSPAAKYVVVEMFDYACPHCRKMQLSVRGARERLGNDLAVIAIPVPMNAECNPTVKQTNPEFSDACELARLAIAVWRVTPNRFEEFHEFLLVGEHAPSAAAARSVAQRLVGEQQLDQQMQSGVPNMYLQKNVEMYEKVGMGIIPKLLFPNQTLVGEIGSVESLIEMIQREAVQPLAR